MAPQAPRTWPRPLTASCLPCCPVSGSSFECPFRASPLAHIGGLSGLSFAFISLFSQVSFIWEESWIHRLTVFLAAAGTREPWKASELRRNWKKGHPRDSWHVLGFAGSLSLLRAECQLCTPCVPSLRALPPTPRFQLWGKGQLAGPSEEPVWTRLRVWDGARECQGESGAASFHAWGRD